jgi:DNA-binding NtrC family response regulator
MSKIRVLLVDDEEDYVKAMAERMDMRDLQSQIALSGEEALAALDEDPPDVMVLDLRMPGMQGMEVLERVRKEHPHIQVIILTGHGGEKEEREARRLGAFEYVQKPADTSDLVNTIQGAWRRSLQVAKELLRDSKDGFDRSMTAAALAEGGMPEEAAEIMSPSPPPVPESPGPGALKVLLVDDEEDYVRTMAERMEMREVGSDVALTGEDALSALEEDIPDVMVLDLKMPGMGGMEVLERVRKEYPQIQVIILTGHGSDAEEVEARRLGAFDYLQKPVDINDLMERVRKAGALSLGKGG